MKPLLPLSPGARQLLELGSQVAPPTPEQGARMTRALAPLLESGACGLLPPAAQATRVFSRMGWPIASALSLRRLSAGSSKLLLAASALAASSGAAFLLGRMSTGEERLAAPHAAALSPPAVPAPVPVPLQLPVADASRELGPEVGAEVGPELTPQRALHELLVAPAPPPSATRPGAGGLRADIQRLARADAALRRGRVAEALPLLAPPVARELREQAAALRAVAGCAARGAAATPNARAVLERWRESAYEARVREACGL